MNMNMPRSRKRDAEIDFSNSREVASTCKEMMYIQRTRLHGLNRTSSPIDLSSCKREHFEEAQKCTSVVTKDYSIFVESGRGGACLLCLFMMLHLHARSF